MGSMNFLLVFTTFVLMVHDGETLRCWGCNSNEYAGCGDPFLGSVDVKYDRMNIVTCGRNTRPVHLQLLPNGTTHETKLAPGLEFYCIKIAGKIFGTKVVMRTCGSGFRNLTESSCMVADPGETIGGNTETCDACAGDLCNGATRVGITVVLMASLLLMM